MADNRLAFFDTLKGRVGLFFPASFSFGTLPSAIATTGSPSTGVSGSVNLVVHTPDARLSVIGSSSVGGIGSANVIISDALTLSDFDRSDLEVNALALITAVAPPDIYADSNRGGSQTPDVGELGLGENETLITRIKIRDSGEIVLLNDNNKPSALLLSSFFGSTNEISPWTLTIQTRTRVVSSTQLATAGGNFANFRFSDAEDQAAINGISADDKFIIAVSRASSAISLSTTGSPASGGVGSVNVIVEETELVGISTTGSAATGGVGSVNLVVSSPPDVELSVTGSSAIGVSGSVNLVVRSPADVKLAVTGSSATGVVGSVNLAVSSPLVLALSDFTTTGRTVTALALITAAAPPTVYADATRSGSQTPDAGELGLGTTETVISRIGIATDGSSITMFDNDVPSALSLSSFFGLSHSISEWKLTIQTADSYVTSNRLVGTGGSWATFSFSSARDRSVLTGISTGDKFIIAIWKTTPATISLAVTGSPSTGVSGSVNLAVRSLPDVELAITGASSTGVSGSVNLAVVTIPDLLLSVTGSPAAGALGSVDLAIAAPLLTIADFDKSGLEVDMLALITADTPPIIYADTTRSGSQTPDDGEIGVGAGETLISRIIIAASGARVLLNDNDTPTSLSLATFFGSSDSTSEWTLTVQTRNHVASSEALAATGGGWANFVFSDTDDIAALNGIAAGDKFIIAVSKAAAIPDLSLSVTGSPSTGVSGSVNLALSRPPDVELGLTGSAATGVPGSVNLAVSSPPDVELGITGSAAIGEIGSVDLAISSPPDVELGVTGSSATGVSGSVNLVVRSLPDVKLAVTGSATTGVSGSINLAVSSPPDVELGITGSSATGVVGSVNLGIEDPLTISDFDSSGLTVDALALITAGASPTLYADSYRGGSQTPDAGDIGVGDSETLISRIQVINGGRTVLMNDNDIPSALTLSSFFGSTDSISPWTLSIQTTRNVASSNQLERTGGGFANFRFSDTDDIAALSGIRAGDKFIVAVWKTSPVLSLSVTGSPSTGGVGSVSVAVDDPTFVRISITGSPSTGGVGSVNLAVSSPPDVELGITGSPSTGVVGSVNLAISSPPDVELGVTGSPSTGVSGSVNLAISSPADVELGVTGSPSTGVVGSVNLTVRSPADVELGITGSSSTGVSGSVGLAIEDPLTISDFDSAGLDVDVLALITADAPPAIYADSNRGGSQTPDVGELGLGTNETLITRIQVTNGGTAISLNDNDVPSALTLSSFFGSSNVISSWTFTIQTADHVSSSDQLASTGGGYANFFFHKADDIASLNGISAGDKFIVAVWKTASIDVSLAVTGSPSTGGVGSVNLAVSSPPDVELEVTGSSATGDVGSINLILSSIIDVELEVTGSSATGVSGSVNLALSSPPDVELGITGSSSTSVSGSINLVIEDPLTLSDFSTTLRNVEALALITAGASPTLYADASRSGSQTPDAGELGLDAAETLITLIRASGDGSTITLFDDDTPSALDLSSFFGSSNTTSPWRLTIQTADSYVISNQLGSVGGSWATFRFTSARDRAVLTGISAGDKFIIAVWKTAPATISLAVTGSPSTGVVGSINLILSSIIDVELGITGSPSTGGVGSVNLAIRNLPDVELGITGSSSTSVVGSVNLDIVEQSPGTPASLSVVSSETSVVLDWADAANATSYIIEWRLGSSGIFKKETAIASTLTLTGLENNSNYQWRVISVRTSAANSPPSILTAFRTLVGDVPNSLTLRYTSFAGEEVVFEQASPTPTVGAYQIASPVHGLGYPDFQGVYEKVSQQPGQTIRRISTDSRLIQFKCLVEGFSYNDWLGKREILHRIVQPTYGDETARLGTLDLLFPNGDVRSTKCYVSGMSYGPSDIIKPGYSIERVIFNCPDPWLYDTHITEYVGITSSDNGFSLSDSLDGQVGIIFPAFFGSGDLVSTLTIVNEGNMISWPMITATGHFSNPVMTNVTTGKTLRINSVIPAGAEFSVDMENRTAKYVLSGTTIDIFGGLDSSSEFWYLVPDENLVIVECDEMDVDFKVSTNHAYVGA